MTRTAPIIPATLFIVAAILLGGATSAGAYANAAIQFAAALGIALALVSRASYPGGTQRGLILLLLGMLALALVQLIPLPPSIWTMLPGRQALIDTYRLTGIDPPWRPLSLVPEGTVGVALSVLPVLAAALIGMRAPRVGLIASFWAIVATMIASVALGLAQRGTGIMSRFYIYEITNRGEPVGFFANSNHLSTLCALAIPVATALFVSQRGSTRPNASWLVLIAIILFALIGIGASNSLAGIGLSIVGILSVYLIARLRRGDSKVRMAVTGTVVITALVIAVAVVALVWGHVVGGTVERGGEMGRAALWARTLDGIRALIPFGSGLGTFASVYPQFEDAQTVTRVFANHAHNDYLEVMMTGGVPALILLLGLAAWWLRTTAVIWMGSSRDAFSEAGTVVTGIIMLHELVDYPIRTAAIGVIFGLCCGVMARPRRIVEPEEQPERATRHVSA